MKGCTGVHTLLHWCMSKLRDNQLLRSEVSLNYTEAGTQGSKVTLNVQ